MYTRRSLRSEKLVLSRARSHPRLPRLFFYFLRLSVNLLSLRCAGMPGHRAVENDRGETAETLPLFSENTDPRIATIRDAVFACSLLARLFARLLAYLPARSPGLARDRTARVRA